MNIINSKNTILYYFIIFFPFSLILGPTFIEIFSGFLIIFLLTSLNKIFLKKYKFYIYIFLLFYFYIVFRSLFFSVEFEKIRSILFYFRFLLFTSSIIFVINRVNDFNSDLVKYIVIIFLMLILDSILQYYNGKNIFNIPLNHSMRASSFFGKELILGSFLFRLLPFILIICVLSKLDFKKNIFKLSAFFSLYFFAVLISGERTSFFLLFLTIFLLIILIEDFRKILFYSLIFFLFINLIFNFIFSNKKPFERMLKYTFSQIMPQKVDSKVITLNPTFFSNYYIFSREHQGHYVIAFRMFLDDPIFGQGPRSFRHVCSQEKFIKSDGICSTHPHNTYLQLLAETGLVGFSFIFILFLFTLKEIVKKFFNKLKYQKRDNKFVKIKYISLIAIFVALFPFVPSGNFFNNWLSFIYYYPIAFYLYSINKSKN